jgi:hypothetical protein
MQQHFQREAKECKLKTNLTHIGFDIFGSLLPPLGLFSQNKLFSYLYKFDQMPQTPPLFP